MASNNTGGVGSGGTGSYANGPVSGLGSIFVNGVRYDLSGATVLSDDTASPSAADLQIGMVVEVDGGVVVPGAAYSTCTAARVRYDSELIGEISSITLDGSNRPTDITVMGQHVLVNAQTQLPPAAANTSPLVQSDKIVVYGLPNGSGGVVATRVDLVAAPAVYKISGTVSAVDLGAQTLSVGNGPQVVHFTGALPSGMGLGSYVRAQVLLASLPSTHWTAAQGGITIRTPLVTDPRDGRLEGVVQPKSGSSTQGYVNGTLVEFNAVLSQLGWPTISAGAGVRIKVEGQYNNGVLTATEAQPDDDSQPDEHELVGQLGVVTSATVFTMSRNGTIYTVTHDSSTDVDDDVTLQPGTCLQVNWQVSDPVDTTHITAKEIEPGSDCH
jgi:hypothetical protein